MLFVFVAVGVGNNATAVRRFLPPFRPEWAGPPTPSDRVGVGHHCAATANFLPRLGSFGSPCPPWLASGVGNNEDSISPMPCAEGASWKYKRPRFVTFGFQVSHDVVQANSDDARHILSHNPRRPQRRNNAIHFRPEKAVIRGAASLSGEREWLTWKSSCKNVNWHQVVRPAFGDIGVARHAWESPLEDSGAVRGNFDLPRGGESSPFEPEVEAADSCKETAMGQEPRRIAHRLPTWMRQAPK
jgi:hypothetical protein